MPLIQWSDELELGNAAIDAQHRKWVGMLNALNEAMLQGRGKAVLGGLLDELIAYTATHFSMEERLMQTHGYPESEKHVMEHRDLDKTIVRLREDFAAGKIMITIAVMRFLKEWLYQHIKLTDKMLGEFLAGKDSR